MLVLLLPDNIIIVLFLIVAAFSVYITCSKSHKAVRDKRPYVQTPRFVA